MSKNIFFILSFTLFTILFISSCKLAENRLNTTWRTVPDTYKVQKDTTNMALLTWQNHFIDSSLKDLINSALQSNLDLAIALQRIEMSRAQVRFAKGLPLPFVTGVASAGQRRFGKYTMDGIGNFDTNFSTNIDDNQRIPEHLPDYYVGLQTVWEADIWQKLKHVKKSALARYLASIEGRNFVQTSLIAEIASIYYELLALDNELEIIQQTVGLQESALEIIKIQKQAGVANELAVQQFEALVLNSKSLEFEIRQLVVEAENRMNWLLGRFPQPIVRNKNTFFEAMPAQINTGIPTQLLRNRPDIRQAEYELIATGADVYAAQAAFYPSFTIVASIGFQTFQPKFLLSPASIAYNVLGGLAAPLLNRSALKARLGVAKASQLEALYQYQKSILTAYAEVANQLAKVENLGQIVALKDREVKVLTEAIETSSNLFRTGRATYLEVIFTQTNALQAKIGLAEVKKRQYQSMVEMYRALGGGWR
jgi:NodT family efflux transporter outer membrane factor (OMF) lipoprotein